MIIEATDMVRRNDDEYLEKLALAGKRGASRAAPQPSRGKAPVPKPPPVLDPSHRGRSIDAIADRLSRIEATTDSDRRAASARRGVRKAETSAFDKKRAAIKDAVEDSGTGQTILKMRPKPLTKLADDKRIGQIELQAAAEILIAYSAIASRLMCRGINFDRVDNGGGNSNSAWPARIAHAVARYQAFAKIWSQRNQEYRDSTLAILIDAIVDERWMRTIANDQGRRVENVEKAIIGGLRDYAARAGWVTGHQGERWKTEAASVFGPGPVELRKAMRRAAVER